jgi:hypothetical protein
VSRRERTTTVRCAQPACGATTFYTFTSQREYGEIHQRQQRTPWRCTRHDRPDEVLRPDQPAITKVLVASRVRNSRYERDLADYEAAVARRSPFARKPDEFIDGMYWLPEGGGHGSGFLFGPGFKAHATDFPEGTRLVVTARIEPEPVPYPAQPIPEESTDV